MPDTIEELIAKLRQDAVIGGGWASIHTSDIEALDAEIKQLGDALHEMRDLAGMPDAGLSIISDIRLVKD